MRKIFLTLAAAATAAPALLAQQNEIYLVGAPTGWDINNDEIVLTRINSNVDAFSGKYDIPAGEFMFRFYKQLGDWDNGSIGAAASGDNIPITFTDGVYVGDIYGNSKANFWVPNWPGGPVEIVVDLEEYTVRLVTDVEIPDAPAPDIYLRGGFNDWGTSADYMFTPVSGQNDVYTGSFNVPEGNWEFKVADSDWGTVNYGANWGEGLGDVTLYRNVDFMTDLVAEGANFVLTNWKGGEMDVTVDLGNKTITIEAPEQNPVSLADMYIYGTFNNFRPNNVPAWALWNDNADTEYETTLNIPAGMFDFYFVYTFLGEMSMMASNSGNVTVTFNDNVYEGTVAMTNGNGGHWIYPDWKGGEVSIKVIVDYLTGGADIVITNISGTLPDDPDDPDNPEKQEIVYVVGAFTDWTQSDDYVLLLNDEEDEATEWVGTFTVPEGELEFFLIYDDMAVVPAEGDGLITFVNNYYSGYVDSNDDPQAPIWHDPTWPGGQITISTDGDEITIYAFPQKNEFNDEYVISRIDNDLIELRWDNVYGFYLMYQGTAYLVDEDGEEIDLTNYRWSSADQAFSGQIEVANEEDIDPDDYWIMNGVALVHLDTLDLPSGEYTLVIPAKYFGIEDYDMDVFYNPEIEYLFTYNNPTTGVDGVGSETSFNVFNLQGVKVMENAKASSLKSLPEGIYIVNGKKVMVRK